MSSGIQFLGSSQVASNDRKISHREILLSPRSLVFASFRHLGRLAPDVILINLLRFLKVTSYMLQVTRYG